MKVDCIKNEAVESTGNEDLSPYIIRNLLCYEQCSTLHYIVRKGRL